MMSVFKEIFRTSTLQGPICALFGDGKYKTMAQKIMESYNRTCKDPSKKFKKRARSSVFLDELDDVFGHDSFAIWTQMELWLQVNVALVFFLRIVDTHGPSLHLVYYCGCLVDKQLRCLRAMDPEAKWIEDIFDKFQTRWARWHRPIHTAAYHANPMFLEHQANEEEEDDVRATLRRLAGAGEFAALWMAFKAFKGCKSRLSKVHQPPPPLPCVLGIFVPCCEFVLHVDSP